MKKTILILLVGALALVGSKNVLAEAVAPAPTVKAVPVKSVFTLPKKLAEGRDPFFPESTRVFQAAMAENSSHTVEISSLVVKGYYRDAKGAFVVINNHTFTVGDEGDVLTPGGRMHIKCVAVLPDTIVIEFNGSMHQLPIKLRK